MSTPSSRKPQVEDVDEDLDDLDVSSDVLDQFTPAPGKSAQAIQPPGPPPPTAATGNSFGLPPLDLEATSGEISDDFSRELAKGMESLMREIGAGVGEGAVAGNEDADGDDGGEKTEQERERIFKAAWEAMLIEGMNGQAAPLGEEFKPGHSAQDTGSGSAKLPGESEDFQKTIRQAMEKLKESETTLKGDSEAAPTDPFEALLASLGGGDLSGLGGEGGESEEELHGMLEHMMGQLMSKEVLYEPLKELHEKFPSFFTDNPNLDPAEKARYEAQFKSVTQIMEVFENPKYSDEDPTMSGKVVGLMTEMQSHGSPPAEIMGPLPPGMAVGPDGIPQMPDGCVVM